MQLNNLVSQSAVASDSLDDEQVLLRTPNGSFVVSFRLHFLHQAKSKGKTDAEVALSHNEEFDNWPPLTAAAVADILAKLDQVLEQAKPQRNRLLWLRRDLFHLNFSHFTIKFAGQILRPSAMVVVASLCAVFLSLYLFWRLDVNASAPISTQAGLIFIFGMLLVTAAHETGHALAATSFGASPGKIGAGIFILFPALYIDLTEVALLERRQRITTSAAGVYFQLIVTSLLALGTACLQPDHTGALLRGIDAIIFASLLSCGLNLIPFLKLDGYWILEDVLKIHKLQESSQREVIRVLIKRHRPQSFFRLIYGVTQIGFFLALFCMAAVSSYQLVRKLSSMETGKSTMLDVLSSHPYALITLAMLSVFLIRLTIRFAYGKSNGQERS
jgi:hypothetical protein